MRQTFAMLCGVLLLLASSVPVTAAQSSEPFYKGVNLTFHGFDATDPTGLSLLLDTLQQMNVNSLQVTFPVYMDSWDASAVNALHEGNAIHQYADSPTIDELAVITTLANQRNMSVWLRPLIDEGKIVETGPENAWRGTIQPADIKAYFESYDALLQYYVATPGITWLVVGSELNSLEAPGYSAYWQSIIALVRQSDATGQLKLTYAQNWDTGQYQGYPDWFAKLDGAAIDAYFPLEGANNEWTSSQIADGLSRWYSQLQELRDHSSTGRLFITEAGLSSQATNPSVLQRPWLPDTDASQVDLQLQESYYVGACQAYRQAVDGAGHPLVNGLFWWGTAVGSVSAQADPTNDKTFEFIGKPAQQVIAGCYAV